MTSPDDPRTLVSADWLAARLGEPGLKVLDASWHMPAEGRDPAAEFAQGHIPGAAFAGLDALSDPGSPLPHMAPSPEAYAEAMARLGVRDGDQVVVYDAAGLFSAARVWWLMRMMGHDLVAVLDGGLPAWRAGGHEVESGAAAPALGGVTPRPDPAMIADADAVAAAPQVVDARSPARFAGAEPEPREGLSAGHIPGSLSLHYRDLLAADGTMRPPAELRAAFEAAGVDLARPIVTSCGSGVTAAILSLALARLGIEGTALYDGSWTEWGASGRPVETGAAR